MPRQAKFTNRPTKLVITGTRLKQFSQNRHVLLRYLTRTWRTARKRVQRTRRATCSHTFPLFRLEPRKIAAAWSLGAVLTPKLKICHFVSMSILAISEEELNVSVFLFFISGMQKLQILITTRAGQELLLEDVLV